MRLFILMLIVTAIEVVLIATIGSEIGFLNTFILIVITALIGSSQLKKQWRFVFSNINNSQKNLSDSLIEGLILIISGVLLITPGFLTDIFGFLGLVPAFRKYLIILIKKNSNLFVNKSFYFSSYTKNSRNTKFNDPNVIDAEYERKD